MIEWQNDRDENTTVAHWTKKLILNIIEWIASKDRNLDYHTTQILTGHESFESYTQNMQRQR